MIGILIAMTLRALCALTLARRGRRASQYSAIIWLLGFFLLRNGYFVAFEMGSRGATPGKRRSACASSPATGRG